MLKIGVWIIWIYAMGVGLHAQVPQIGQASFYHQRFEGRRTASGDIFRQMGYTAAHRSLPFGSWVRVTNLSNLRAVIVRINDRGPYSRGKIIDLAQRAAFEIGLTPLQGQVKVMVEHVEHPGSEIELLKLTPALGTRHLFKIQPPPVTPSF